jgi:hypothetical protein
MVAEDFDKELTPGKSTKIKVNVQLPPMPQSFYKNLAIQTNNGVLPLDVVGEIAANSNMYCVPEKVNFGTIKKGEIKERLVRIARHDLSPIKLKNVVNNCLEIKPEPYNMRNKNDNIITLKIRLQSNQLSLVGRFDTNVLVCTFDESFQNLNIPVSFEIVEND